MTREELFRYQRIIIRSFLSFHCLRKALLCSWNEPSADLLYAAERLAEGLGSGWRLGLMGLYQKENGEITGLSAASSLCQMPFLSRELDLLYPAGYGKNDLIIKWSDDKRTESISG